MLALPPLVVENVKELLSSSSLFTTQTSVYVSKYLYPYYNTEVLRAQPSLKVTLTPCHPALPLVAPVLVDNISLQESWALFSDHCDPSFLKFLYLALLGPLPEPRLKESPATYFTTIVLMPSVLQCNP